MTAGLDAPESGVLPTHLEGKGTLEARGWSPLSVECAPKIAALVAAARLDSPQSLPSVSYRSRGNLLIVAGADPVRAEGTARALASDLAVTLLALLDWVWMVPLFSPARPPTWLTPPTAPLLAELLTVPAL